jgi:CBS domain-containing protein
MEHANVGSVLVTAAGELVGIISERELARRVVTSHRRPGVIRLEEVMKPIEPARAELAVVDALLLMTERRWRHLPVGTHVQVLGVVSIGDLAKWVAGTLDAQLGELERFIAGPCATQTPTWPPSFWELNAAADMPGPDASLELWVDGMGG